MTLYEAHDNQDIEVNDYVLVLCEPFDGGSWVVQKVEVTRLDGGGGFDYHDPNGRGTLGLDPAGGSWQDAGPAGDGPTLHVFVMKESSDG